MSRLGPPALALTLLLACWEAAIRLGSAPPWILPSPSAIGATLIEEGGGLARALAFTTLVALAALAGALASGIGAALLFARYEAAERALMPIAVILQVTPLIAIAPLILIWLDGLAALILCAWLVAFFPILASALAGLKSADRALLDLAGLYGASETQKLLWLKAPSMGPQLAAGLETAAGLSLIGAVVAEFVAGGAFPGIAYRILEASYRLDTPKLFAGLVLLASAGVALFGGARLIGRMFLR